MLFISKQAPNEQGHVKREHKAQIIEAQSTHAALISKTRVAGRGGVSGPSGKFAPEALKVDPAATTLLGPGSHQKRGHGRRDHKREGHKASLVLTTIGHGSNNHQTT